MARKATKGTLQIGSELDADLVAAFRAFARSRGEYVRDHLEIAIQRHMDNPPGPLKPVVAPLPPYTTPKPRKPRKSRKL